MISHNFNDPYIITNKPCMITNDPYTENDAYNYQNHLSDPYNHIDPYLTFKDPYLQNFNTNNNNNNNCNNYNETLNRVIFWRDDVITLTGHLINTLESLIQVQGSILIEFHRGKSYLK